MRYESIQDRKQISMTFPFVCHFMPFVCLKLPYTFPFVGWKVPFIGNKGFTLIELVVTVTIAGILLAIAVPSLSGIIQNHRLSGQANDLIADLNVARSEAIKRAVNVTVCKQDPTQTTPSCNASPTAPWTSGWVIFIDSNSDGQVTAGETVLRVRQALAGNGNIMTSAATDVTNGPYSNAANLVIYQPSGMTTIKPGVSAQFRLCDSRGPSQARTIQLISTGRATVNSAPATTCPTSSNW